nr:MAG TPA: hypothetical protein [Caudoviricetes sp.]
MRRLLMRPWMLPARVILSLMRPAVIPVTPQVAPTVVVMLKVGKIRQVATPTPTRPWMSRTIPAQIIVKVGSRPLRR